MKKFLLLSLLVLQVALSPAATIYALNGDDQAKSTFWTDSNLSVLTTALSASSLTINPLRVGIPTMSGQSGRYLTNNGSAMSWASATTGTVTSVALSLPGIFTVSGSPVTTSGTLTAALATQTANRIWAGPSSGSAAVPTFRALVAGDLPDLSSVYQPYAAALTTFGTNGSAYYLARANHTGTQPYTTITGLGTLATQTATITDYLLVATATSTYLPLAGGTMTGTLQLGTSANASIADQIIIAGSGITGTDRDGGSVLIKAGSSTGSGSGAVRFYTPAAGSTGTTTRTTTERLRIDSTGVWIENTTAPASNPATGAFILYVDPADNKLKARGSSGTITELAQP